MSSCNFGNSATLTIFSQSLDPLEQLNGLRFGSTSPAKHCSGKWWQRAARTTCKDSLFIDGPTAHLFSSHVLGRCEVMDSGVAYEAPVPVILHPRQCNVRCCFYIGCI
eukprot:4577930-Amphidinium_carterae.1